MIPRKITTISHTTFSLPTARNCQSGVFATSTMATIQRTSAPIHRSPKSRPKSAKLPHMTLNITTPQARLSFPRI